MVPRYPFLVTTDRQHPPESRAPKRNRASLVREGTQEKANIPTDKLKQIHPTPPPVVTDLPKLCGLLQEISEKLTAETKNLWFSYDEAQQLLTFSLIGKATF